MKFIFTHKFLSWLTVSATQSATSARRGNVGSNFMQRNLKYNFNQPLFIDNTFKVYLYKNTLTLKETSEILIHLDKIKGRKVICGDLNISWFEKEITKNDPYFNRILNDELFTQFYLLSKFNPDSYVKIWASIYKENEYINRHKDRSGNFQALLCLSNTKNNNSGYLVLELDSETKKIHLNYGDIIFFDASKIPHYTTPTLDSEVERITLAIRTYK